MCCLLSMFCFQESPPKGDDPFLLLAKSSSATSTANDAPTVPPMIPYSVPFERGRDEYENRARKAPVLPYFLPPGSPPVHHQSPADTLPVPPGEADFSVFRLPQACCREEIPVPQYVCVQIEERYHYRTQQVPPAGCFSRAMSFFDLHMTGSPSASRAITDETSFGRLT